MNNLWNKSLPYSLLRPYVDLCTRTSYSSLKVIGQENIPSDGAVIIASNHCNTLMDALVVLQSFDGPVCFGARADIFKGRTANILRFLRIVPLPRARDGVSVLRQSEAIIDEIVEVLKHKVPFTIFPEGTHNTNRSLLPLKKGIWRIAVKAAGSLDMPVYIVPAGIEYESYYDFMGSARLCFGEPIKITKDTDAAQLLSTLRERMEKLVTCFPKGEGRDTAVKQWKENIMRSKGPLLGNIYFRRTLAALLFPLFTIASLLCLPQLFTSAVLCQRLQDKAWKNSMRFVSRLIINPLIILIESVLGFVLLPIPAAIGLLLLSQQAMRISYSWIKLLKPINP